jgi:hypothetical protein
MKYLRIAAAAVALTLTTTTVAQAASTIGFVTMGIKITNVTGKARDWVGIFPHGAADNAYTDWVYVACDAKSCADTPAKVGSTVTVHLNIPTNAGLTDLRYFTLDGSVFTAIAQVDPDLSPH